MDGRNEKVMHKILVGEPWGKGALGWSRCG